MGDDVTLQALLVEHPSLATAADYNGRTPLVSGRMRAEMNLGIERSRVMPVCDVREGSPCGRACGAA